MGFRFGVRGWGYRVYGGCRADRSLRGRFFCCRCDRAFWAHSVPTDHNHMTRGRRLYEPAWELFPCKNILDRARLSQTTGLNSLSCCCSLENWRLKRDVAFCVRKNRNCLSNGCWVAYGRHIEDHILPPAYDSNRYNFIDTAVKPATTPETHTPKTLHNYNP